MRTKTKYILAISLVSVISLALLLGIIAIVASLKTSVAGGFKISYVAQNVHANVYASYAIAEPSENDISNVTVDMPTWTTIKAGGSEYIAFNANDTAEEITKSFDGIDVEITKNQYLYFKYTFVHTGDETNSMKFLNIAPTLTFTTINNMTMEYGSSGLDGKIYWCNELTELTAVRGENATVDVYIRFSITTRTLYAYIEGDLVWDLTGSEEYAYDNAYLPVGLQHETLGEIAPTSIVFEKDTSGASVAPVSVNADGMFEQPNISATATSGTPYHLNGSYGISAYMDGTTLHIVSPYNIKATSCGGLIMHMVADPSIITNISFNNFDTSNVTDMSQMFFMCGGLTSLDLSGFDTSNVTNMSGMFTLCSGLTELNLSNFDTSNVTFMSSMFMACDSLTTLSLSNFSTSNVTNMSAMFQSCIGLTDLDVSSFDTSNVTDMSWMMYDCNELTRLDLSQFNTSKVTNMSFMFSYCSGLTTIYVGESWSNSAVTSSTNMFFDCTSLVGGGGKKYSMLHVDATYAQIESGYFMDINELRPSVTLKDAIQFKNYASNATSITFDYYKDEYNSIISGVTPTAIDVDSTGLINMYIVGTDVYVLSDGKIYANASCDRMFYNMTKLTSIEFNNFRTTKVTNMSSMFNGCSGLTELDLSGWDTSNVTNMSNMFDSCRGLTSLDLSPLKTTNVTNMSYMFYYCSGLTSLDLSPLKTTNVTDMASMFESCSGLTSLDLSGWDTSNVTNMRSIFSN